MKVSPKDLIRIHQGQIASRSLSKKLAIAPAMTLYAMSKEESISREVSDQTKLIQVIEGQLSVTYDDGHQDSLTAGELVSLASGQGHALTATEDTIFWQLLLD
ncbi:hypothetical protein [Streptococcus sp. DD12]|uniref:hypothetical protein n=1 Tax=Streptococcus sp. DD12 TaxID=1777880 RepID=UPI0007960C55|nr:hypothetical protein [Streptococcus sp. DD12]KXT75584.1 hypothetical protein STRDD12_01395 [Streptococcus sp. DD12]